jgi:hypothetical protein
LKPIYYFPEYIWIEKGMNEYCWSYTAHQQQPMKAMTGAAYPQNESYYKTGSRERHKVACRHTGKRQYRFILSIIDFSMYV